MVAVLLVDDRPGDRHEVSAALESLGCDVEIATSGDEALLCVAARDYVAMIIDLRVPTIDGIATATRLRAVDRARRTPVILIGEESPTATDERQFLGAGIVHFLEKPLDLGLLCDRVAALIDHAPLSRPRERGTILLDRLARLQSATTALSRALTPDAVTAVVLEHGVRAMAADACAVYALRDATVTLLGHHGLPSEVAMALTVARDDEAPGLELLRRGRPVYSETLTALSVSFPMFAGASGGPRAAWAVPLHGADAMALVVVMGFVDERAFDDEEREFIATFTRQCALAFERAHLYEEQRDAVRARDDFLSVASHELNTPLAAMKLQIGRLLRHPPPASEVPERLRLLDRQVDRLTALVGDLLDVSRLRAGRYELARAEVDLGDLVVEVATRLDPGGERLQLAVERARGLWDRTRLEQVVTNLLSNALKYGGGRPVDVTLAAREAAVLTVRDRGIGIAYDDQERIFDRFERAVSGRRFSGLGLGLWISRRIVEAHGGTIEVASAVGDGATFTVRLPWTDGVAPID